MDFTQAKKIFAGYLRQYDTTNDKIRLKVVHTYGVVRAASFIADGLGLSQEDTDLALHIALLHDIGRFEQLRQYNSFDDSIVPHAELSLKILFDDHMLEQFIPERAYDSVIHAAIKNHGLYRMDPSLTGRELLHSQIIRDADKLDNFRVKEEDSITAMLDVDAIELGSEDVSGHILESFLNRIPIKNSDRVTHMDMWISYLGYIYDLNFPASRRYVAERGIIDKLIDRIPYSNEATRRKMELIRQAASSFLSESENESGNADAH